MRMFNNDDLQTNLLARYGIGVWEPRHHDSTKVSNTAMATYTVTPDNGCFRGDSFPPNSPFVTGDKVCVQPQSYGPYRHDSKYGEDSAHANLISFKWDGSAATRTDNNGFRRVFQCVGGDLCNKIYPLEDLYRHEMNLETGMLDFVGLDMNYYTIETYEMTEEEQILTGDKSETVWKLLRDSFPLFTAERTAWFIEYDTLDTTAVDALYQFDYSGYTTDMATTVATNEITQMTQPIINSP